MNPSIRSHLSAAKILVTGGAGFIGSHIVESLLDYGVKDIVVLDDLSSGRLKNIEQLIKDKRIQFIHGDIRSAEDCRKAMDGVNAICHQAGMNSAEKSRHLPNLYNEVNVNGFINILLTAQDLGIRRIVYASSSSVYGTAEQLPNREEDKGIPLSPYAISKVAMEHYADWAHRMFGLEIIGLRYFNVFGPRQRADSRYSAVIPRFIDAMMQDVPPTIYGDGQQTRDFTFIKNIVQANLHAICCTNPEAFGKNLNVGTGGSVAVLDIFEHLRHLLGNHAIQARFLPKRPLDRKHSYADISKARQLIGYEPDFSVKEGLKATVHAFMNTQAISS